MMVSMKRPGNVVLHRYLYGKSRICPLPVGKGEFAVSRTRWVLIRAGLESIIEALPRNERQGAAKAQELWAFACRQLEDGGQAPEGNWEIQF